VPHPANTGIKTQGLPTLRGSTENELRAAKMIQQPFPPGKILPGESGRKDLVFDEQAESDAGHQQNAN